MGKTNLDLEEKELLEAYELGGFTSELDADRRECVVKAAKEAFKKGQGPG